MQWTFVTSRAKTFVTTSRSEAWSGEVAVKSRWKRKGKSFSRVKESFLSNSDSREWNWKPWRTIRYANFKSQQTRLPAMNTQRGCGKIFDPLVNLASLRTKVAQRRGKQHTASTIYFFISFNTLQTCYSRAKFFSRIGLSPLHTVRKELANCLTVPHVCGRMGIKKKNDPRLFSWGFMLSFQNTADSRDLQWKHSFHRREPINMAVHCLFLRHLWACRAFGHSQDSPKER